MKKPLLIAIFCILFSLSAGVYGIGENVLVIGSSSSWNLIENMQGIIEASLIRPNPVLMLGGTRIQYNDSIDLYLSFDGGSFNTPGGNYHIGSSGQPSLVGSPLSRMGDGAIHFRGNGRTGSYPLVLTPGSNALFAPGNHLMDFSIEFWLCPQNLENGEQIFTMTSSLPLNGHFLDQSINCIASRSRLNWTFNNFFFFPGLSQSINIILTSPPIINQSWSHHLIRYDADLGIIEYIVDGRLEDLAYTTSNGRESGQIFFPVIGEDSSMVLGARYTGLMDEFIIKNSVQDDPVLVKYLLPGRIESHTIDLGFIDSRILLLEALGGRTEFSSSPGQVSNFYAGNNSLRFSDFSEIRFFLRYSNNPYEWGPWIPVIPGIDVSDNQMGRYVQIAAEFYPGMNGNGSPYLEEIRLTYLTREPPPPPSQLIAIPQNGSVELTWRSSSSRNIGGYIIYYGTARGEYFSAMPIDVGNTNSYTIDGLNNGTLYYFVIAAYDRLSDYLISPHPGAFSVEVAARPLAQQGH